MRTNFLNYGLKIILVSVLLYMPFVFCFNQEKPFIWFVISGILQIIIGVILWIFIEKTVGRICRPTPIIQQKYNGSLSELIIGFDRCDIYFKNQIGGCYIFETNRLIWFNQRFLVELSKNYLLINASEFSFKQLKNHSLYCLFPKLRDNFSTKNYNDNKNQGFPNVTQEH